MPNVLTDPAETFSARELISVNLPNFDPNEFEFKHTPPDDKPEPPDYPGTLDEDELAEVDAWRDGLVEPTLPAAITYKDDYEEYNVLMDAWQFANKAARVTQFRIAMGDSQIYNRATTAVASDPGGAGDTPPPSSVYPRQDP